MQRVKKCHPMFLAALAATLATAPASATSQPVTPDNPPDADATVVVRNYNSLDVQVFAVTEEGKRYELGTVHRASERTLEIPEGLVANSTPFRLKIYSIARAMPASVVDNHVAGVKTQVLEIADGDEIQLTVKSPLVASFIDRGSPTPD